MSKQETSAVGPWLVVAMLWVVALLNYLDRLMLTTMRESLCESIPMTDAQFGLLTSVFLWVYAILSPPAGYLADRFGRSRVIILSVLVWSAVTWLTTLAQSFTGLLIARALMGISEACYLPAALALIADYHRGPTRSLATSVHITGLYVGSAMGGLGGVLAEHFGWRSGFTIFGVFGIAYAGFLACVLRDPPTAPTAKALEPGKSEQLGLLAGFLALLRQPSFLILLTIFSLFSIVNWGILTWLPTYLQEAFHLGQGRAGLSATISNQIGSLAGILLGGFLADRWSRTNVRGRLLVPLLGICLAGPCLLFSTASSFLWLSLLGFALYGMGKSFGDANWMPILCQIADPRYRATGYGVMNLASCLVGGGMAYLGGVLRDAQVELGIVFQAFGLVYFAAGCMFLLIRPRRDLEA
ncbi:MAG: MFS transporter [Thermoguttaceae bacterium]